jgi:hypothetical protein
MKDVDDEDDEFVPGPKSPPEEQLEEGNRIWAMGLLLEPEYIWASSMTSQWLAEAFKQNSELADYERHIPPHLCDFHLVFSKDCLMIYPNPNLGTTLLNL